MALKPPPIRGKVPEGYDGPIFYRMTNFDPLMRGGLPNIFSVAPSDRKRRDKMFLLAGREKWKLPSSGLIFDADGTLLPEWQAPFRGIVSQKSKAGRIEFVPQHISMISERVHAFMEELEPGQHMFFPVDAEGPDGSISRFYYLFFEVAPMFGPLHPGANNLESRPSKNGSHPVYQTPGWLSGTRDEYASKHFGYLDRARVSGRHFFYAGDTSLVFSEELLFRIGGAFPKWCSFVPMGAVADGDLPLPPRDDAGNAFSTPARDASNAPVRATFGSLLKGMWRR